MDRRELIKNGKRRSDREGEYIEHAGQKHARVAPGADMGDKIMDKWGLCDQKEKGDTGDQESGIAIFPCPVIGERVGEAYVHKGMIW